MSKRFIMTLCGIMLCAVIILVVVAYIVDRKQRTDFLKEMSVAMSESDIGINKSAPAICRHEIYINAPIDIVWDKLTSIEKWTEWQASISSSEINTLPEKYAPFVWTSDGIGFESIIHTSRRYESFGWIGTTWGAQAVHNWHFEEVEGGVKIIVEESLQGLLVDIMTDYFRRNLKNGVQISLEELKKSCEN